MLPHLCEDPSDEVGGVLLGHVHMAEKAGVKAIKCIAIEAHELEGVLLDVVTI